MSLMEREKMLKKYRYLTNTTKTAKERQYLEKELPCKICGKPITEQDVESDNCEATVRKGDWSFFHRTCITQK